MKSSSSTLINNQHLFPVFFFFFHLVVVFNYWKSQKWLKKKVVLHPLLHPIYLIFCFFSSHSSSVHCQCPLSLYSPISEIRKRNQPIASPTPQRQRIHSSSLSIQKSEPSLLTSNIAHSSLSNRNRCSSLLSLHRRMSKMHLSRRFSRVPKPIENSPAI